MRVFQRYFGRMAKVIKKRPRQFAKKLFEKRFIAKKTMEKVESFVGLTSLQEAEILLRAVDTGNITDESGKWLKKFCRFLDKRQCLKELSAQMLEKFGRLCDVGVQALTTFVQFFKSFIVKLRYM